MRKLSLNITIIFVLMGLFACEDVYNDLKVENYKPAIVIEGLITDEIPPYYIKVFRSVAFGDSTYNNYISGAEVRLSDNEGNTELLSMQSPGIYRADSIRGKPGNVYSLDVKVGDSVFSSKCVMPSIMLVDSLIPIFYQDDGNNTKGYHLKLFGRKPQNDSVNFYKCLIYQNNRLINNHSYSLIFSDEHTSVQEVEFPETFALHDTAEIEIQSITKEVFDYFLNINMLIIDNSFIFDYQKNPHSNISNGAFGYFQASAVRKIKVIIQ